MTAHRYASTVAAKYLAERFGFEFTGRPEIAALEDLIWEMGRQAQRARQNVRDVAEALIDDAGYAIKSMTGGTRPDIYEVPERANLHELIALANGRERDLRQWIAALGVVDEAYGHVRQHLDRYRSERDEARQELAAARNRLSVLAQQRADLEHKAMNGADRIDALAATAAEQDRLLSDARGRVVELERSLDEALKQLSIRDDQLKSWTEKANRLEGELSTARREAEDFADERDDAQRERRTAIDDYHAMVQERDEALAKARDQQNRAEELEETLKAHRSAAC